MSEAQQGEQQTQLPVGAVEGRPGVVCVTQDNFNQYVNQELGDPASAAINPDPEAEAQAEFEALEAAKAAEQAKAAEPKEGDIDGANVYFKGKWVKKHDFNYRLHVKTEEAKKEAEAAVTLEREQAKTLREQLAKAEQERNELKAKYEPPQSMEIGAKPDPAKYTDLTVYSDDLEKWAANKARVEAAKENTERQAKAAQESALKNWNERQAAVQAEIPDYAAKIAASPIQVSNEMRDAILESEVGPKILYHFAEHPEVAEALGKLTVRKMLVEFGRLEASLGSAEKPQTKSAPVAEVSKAPPPITPLKGSSPGTGTKVDAAGNWTGTFEEYKAQRAKLLQR